MNPGRQARRGALGHRHLWVGSTTFALAALLAIGTLGATARAAEGSASKEGTASADDASVAATINGKPIPTAELQRTFDAVLAGRQVAPEALEILKAEALEQFINRRLVESALAGDGKSISPEQVDAELAKFVRQLSGQKLTLEKFLADKHLTPAALREQIVWQLLWARTMEQQLTDSVLEAYFKAHQKEFDGSEVRASHILFRPARVGDPKAEVGLIKDAAALREKIASDKISFVDAAARYSAGPSREKGGDIGFIPRHDVMAEPFSAAAFALEPGQISQPVVSPFGVHLIQVTEVKPGTRKWTEVREQLKPPAAQALFEKIAARQRAKAKIEYTSAWPHFKPGSKELAAPK